MGAKTKIAWADSTWPVINGCRRVTEGCRNCYAERLCGTRLKHNEWYAGLTDPTPDGPRWNGKWRLNEPHLNDPLRWRDPRWIFPCDRGDLFFEPVPFEVIDKVFAVMALAPQHRFLVLTKRPERAAEYAERILRSPDVVAHAAIHLGVWEDADSIYDQVHADIKAGPLENVWIGTSIHDQSSAEEFLDALFKVPAANYFVSYEPALGYADLKPWLHESDCPVLEGHADCVCKDREGPREKRLGLVIVGGESDQNYKARPHRLSVARSVIWNCKVAGVPVFNKQLGSCPIAGDGEVLPLAHRAGADKAEWPKELRVQQMPEFG